MKRSTTEKKTVLFSDRRFINSPGHGGSAFISANIVEDKTTYHDLFNEDGSERVTKYMDANIDIADCNRTIHWELNFRDEKSLANSKYKVQQALEVFQGLKDFLETVTPDEDID